jgi:hypothetical protein
VTRLKRMCAFCVGSKDDVVLVEEHSVTVFSLLDYSQVGRIYPFYRP